MRCSFDVNCRLVVRLIAGVGDDARHAVIGAEDEETTCHDHKQRDP